MATVAVRHLDRKTEHLFFSGMSLLMLIVVFIGFSRTYYLAGVFHAPLPSAVIHVHGAVFSLWILLLNVQAGLVYAGRTDLHRKLGVAGFTMAVCMVVLGVMAATDALRRGHSPAPGVSPETFYFVPMSDMVVFATLILFAIRERKNPPAHKRLILLANIGLMVAAIARFPVSTFERNPISSGILSDAFLLLMMVYDHRSTGKVQKVTLWGSLLIVGMQFLRLPIGMSPAWRGFANRIEHLGRAGG